MIECNDKSYYVGSTRDNLEKRISEHNSGAYIDSYTAKRLPVKLVFSEYFSSITDAIACERQIKGWRRAKKEALICGDYAILPQLTKTAKPCPSLLRQAQDEV